MRIVIVITDEADGRVKVEPTPKASELVTLVKEGRLAAATSAAMYALGMLTWCAKRSREMRQEPLIVLPPGIRE